MWERFEKIIEEKKSLDLYRTCKNFSPTSPVKVDYNGQEYLMMASNNYLGLTHHEYVKKAAIQAIQAYGTGSGGSRLINGSHLKFKELEEALATFKGTECALVFNTGYMANVGVISAVTTKDDLIFSDELNHASIIDGCRMSKAKVITYKHNDIGDLSKKLKSTPCMGMRLLVTDGVFSMDGDIAPLPDIVSLKKKYNFLLMVDDAHATGVLGNGRGSGHHFGISDEIDIQLGTLSKALGSVGGYVAVNHMLKDYLINVSRPFIFSTALSPADIGAAKAALELIDKEPCLLEQLQKNVKYMAEGLRRLHIEANEDTPIFPIIIGNSTKTLALAKELEKRKIILSAIRPPTVSEESCRLRLTVTAAHSQKDLDYVIDSLKEALEKLHIL